MASAEATRGAGLFLLMFNGIYAGGPVFIKNHPGVRCCGRRGGLFCYLCVDTGGERKQKGKLGKTRPVASGRVMAAAPGLARLTLTPPNYDTS